MGILRNRRVFGRALVSTLAFAVSVGLLACGKRVAERSFLRAPIRRAGVRILR